MGRERKTPVPVSLPLTECLPCLYRILVDNSPHGISLWHASTDDPDDLVFLWVNKQGGVNFGDSLEGYFGKTLRELRGTPIDSIPECRPTMIKVANGDLVEGAKTIAGESLEFGGSIFRVYFQHLGDRMVAVIFEDATDEYRAVQDFKAREKKARKVLEQRAEDLKRSNRDLEQFAYVASHDLQEPLRMVSSYCSLLREEYGDKLDEEGLTYIQYAVDGANRMKSLIQGLLEFSRVGRNATFTWLKMDDALNDALAVLDCTKGCPVIVRDPLPEVYGDKTMLMRLFLNLIGNAMKFRKKDEPLIIHITCESTPLKWQFAVKDNGVGFDQHYSDRIFQLFQRLNGTKNGTGIGLAICKKILDRHAGSIWVESSAGEGSTFFFSLGKIVTDSSTASSQSIAVLKLAKVLLVEDNPGDVLLMRKALTRVGVRCTLRIEMDGVAAIAALADGVYRPDIILLDLNLPRKGGQEVLNCLKSDIQLRRIPVIVLSSSSSQDDIGACYDLHANGYVVKPEDPTTYAEMIRSLSSFWFEHASLPMH